LRSIPRYPNLRTNEHYHQKNDCQNNHSFPKAHSRQCQFTRIREGWRPNYALPCFWEVKVILHLVSSCVLCLSSPLKRLQPSPQKPHAKGGEGGLSWCGPS
jgi:hypothetical protein